MGQVSPALFLKQRQHFVELGCLLERQADEDSRYVECLELDRGRDRCVSFPLNTDGIVFGEEELF